ncbi:protein phosphatase 2C domain-containing protein [bacterium]|nr:protein phosphatase 2C domain-containing protein [bacterium]
MNPPNHHSSSDPFRVSSGLNTSIGYFRDNNEDRIVLDDRTMIYVVADGMGGQAAGEQASQMAVDIVPATLRELLSNDAEPISVREAIKRAVLLANQSIVQKGDNDPSTQNMGTTIVLSVCRNDKMFVAHIGDSRAYLVRDGKIRRITTDHNLAQALFEANTISAEELDTHRFRHVLWKYLGSKEVGEGPDMTEIELHDGDRFLLATDGLTGSLSDELIRDEIVRATDPTICADKLVKLALDNGSRDNVTGAVLFVTGPVASAETPADGKADPEQTPTGD